jgi:serine/threonine protein kinase
VLEGPSKGKSVAIKIIDLEQFEDNSIDEIRKEISIMSTCQHKNVVSCHVSFIEGTDLWLTMPILSAGSCLDVLRLNFHRGIMDEAVIATILKETMLGLKYFHENKQIHRDIKAGNILLDMEGNVFISDFGVSASLKRGQKRKTFVGSPCWMAPEVMEQTGHDYSADIWSLGITAIELSQGEAPYADLPAMKVLLKILKEDPPQLGTSHDWDPVFRNFIESCL